MSKWDINVKKTYKNKSMNKWLKIKVYIIKSNVKETNVKNGYKRMIVKGSDLPVDNGRI